MHSFRQIQSWGPQARVGQQSTYGADYKPPSDRPLSLFRLHAEPSCTTHQKLVDVWAQYHRQCFQTSTNGPRNPASAFTQKGRTVRAAMLESENFSKIPVERTAPREKGQSQIPPKRSSFDSGERRSVSPSLSWTSVHNSGPSRPARKEAWMQATGDPALGVSTKAKDGVELPHIGSGEGSDAEPPLQLEGLRAEQFRRDMTHSSRLEGQINQRIATQSNLMHLGLPFDGVTTYSQSYTLGQPPTLRGPQRILPEATLNWRAWESEYQDRYQGPDRYVPGQRKPPSGLDQTRGHIRSEYQRHFTKKNYPGLARTKTSPAYRDD
ncbi:uncharacterized protein LOC121559488 [Coregonus clupeaformis]|uniref:uncharacterized protein LOC121559488 n=1 Tax=Coregonus clupeaformis TaxID=59861 RepID=UPI001BE07E91|nr:uncharacterized protein LOC121559488 [Coregonus clupeaformis]